MTSRNGLLITRTDRLGDVLMSLPAVERVQSVVGGGPVDFLVRTEWFSLLGPWASEKGIGLQAYQQGVSVISWKKYQGVLFLIEEPNLVLGSWLKRVPVRVGMRSKWTSFVGFTAGIRQKRSQAEMNEGEYNLELANLFLDQLGYVEPVWNRKSIRLPINRSASEVASEVLGKHQISKPYVVVHPGMSGSALNWKPRQYLAFIEGVQKEFGVSVILTCGPSKLDVAAVEEIVAEKPQILVVRDIELTVLAELFRMAKLVVAPSTGPLHLAHLVGTATFGIFSPVRSHSEMRWGPFGGEGRRLIYSPGVSCRATTDCLGRACREYFCMDQMTWGRLPLGLKDGLKGLFGGKV